MNVFSFFEYTKEIIGEFMSTNKDRELLSKQLNVKGDWESCVYDLFNPRNPLKGEAFFKDTILKLCKYLDADYVFVAKLNGNDKELDAVAYCDKDELLPSFKFEYDGTPCENVLSQNSITYKSSVQVKFPEDLRLKKMSIEAYSGVPLIGSAKEPIGVLTALFCKPIEDAKRVEALMYMFSSRLALELEHLEEQRELKRRNLELLVFKEELIRKNRELDEMNQELKKANLKAKESAKLKSSFLANLSHEIRTPMNAIIGFTELLRSNDLNKDERQEYLNIIYQNGNQLMRVMDALIDISKLQAKVYIDKKEKVHVNKILSDIHENYSEELSVIQKPVEFNLILGDKDGKDLMYAHKEALLKVFDHLLSNAFKFTKQGKVYIGYTIEDDCFEFFVKDTGIGIPSGFEDYIFDLFRQAEIENSREFGGNGIGLSIVKKYVEIMGGEVWAEPDQKEGALLKFTVPIS